MCIRDSYIISAPWIKLVMSVPKPVLPLARGAAKILPKMTINQNIDEGALGNPDYVKPYKKDVYKRQIFVRTVFSML